MKFRIALGILACIVSQALYANPAQLGRDDVEQILAQAATQASRTNRNAVIAVTDREGFVLGIWDVAGRLPNPLPGPLPGALFTKQGLRVYGQIAAAVSRAGTAAFLSSNENAFTSRTAGYIIQQHFPVGVRNTPPGPLVGVGFSNLFYSDINRFKQILPGFNPADVDHNLGDLRMPTRSPGARGFPVAFTSLNDSPGGVPLYKQGELVGGLGVTGDNDPTNLAPAVAIIVGDTQSDATAGFKKGRDEDEEVALAGQTGFRPSDRILATNVLLGGIRIPYVNSRPEDIRDVEDTQPLGSIGRSVDGFDVQEPPPPYPFEVAHFGGIEGEVRIPIRDDPRSGKIGKAERLTKEEVKGIIREAAERCGKTRAAIRLPIGVAANVWIVVVNNPNKNGEPPDVLGTFRVGDAPMFSWDVATQKARTAVFFSNRQLAMSSRTVGFLAQRYYPPGLDGRPRGPLFGFQEAVSLRLKVAKTKKLKDLLIPPNPNLPNGITIFPGGFPLYRNGYLVGAVGVSGDGVDQDDIIGASGCKDFLPSFEIRADQYIYRGARLPYAKFPRDPVR